MRVVFLMLALLAAPPPEQPKRPPLKVGVELTLSQDAKVYVELPAPEVGDRFKVLTADQFRKHIRYIMWAEYELTYVRVDGMEILEARFTLPKPKTRSNGHHVSKRPERVELPPGVVLHGARGQH